MNIVIRPLRKSDIIDIYGHTFPQAVRGLAAVADGKVLGIAGVLHSKPLQCFSQIGKELRKYPRVMIKAIKMLRVILNSYSTPVYAVPDQDEPTAWGFCQHVGFTPLSNGRFVWQIL